MSAADITPELHALGSGIFNTFKRLADEPCGVPCNTDLQLQHHIVVQEQRFRLWAHSLGLHQKGHSSLDYRVRDAVIARNHLTEILTELKEHLENRKFTADASNVINSLAKSDPSYRVNDHHSNKMLMLAIMRKRLPCRPTRSRARL